MTLLSSCQNADVQVMEELLAAARLRTKTNELYKYRKIISTILRCL